MDTKIVVGLCVAIVVTAVSIAGIALSVKSIVRWL